MPNRYHKIAHARVPKRILFTLLILVIGFFGAMLGTLNILTERVSAADVKESQYESLLRTYANMNLEARSVIVYDATHDKMLFGLKPTVAMPLASISKVMTALIGRTILSKDSQITITKGNRTDSPDLELRLGDTWNAKDLTQYSLVKSSNDGATAICDAVTELTKQNNTATDCLTLMNQYAANHGLKTLSFANPSGLDLKNGDPSNMGSAYDVARLLNSAYNAYPSLFGITTEPLVTFKAQKFVYQAENTDLVLDRIENVLAGKTGYTDSAGGNLAILYAPKPDLHIAIVVLGSSHDGRFDDMVKLVERTNAYVNAYNL